MPSITLRAGADHIGGRILDAVVWVLELAALAGLTLGRTCLGGMNRVSRVVLLRQIYYTGVQALPFAALMAAAMAVGLLPVFWLVQPAQQPLIAGMLATVLVREVAPALAVLVVTARSAGAIAAELAAMTVNGEVESLECLGVDPLDYLVAPRLAAVAVAVACLSVFIVGFTVLALVVLLPASGAVADGMALLFAGARQVGWMDIAAFLARTLLSGVLIGAAACLCGLRAGGSVTEVPRAVSKALVAGLGLAAAWHAAVALLLPQG